MALKESFLLHNCWWEPISDLPDKYLGMLFRAIYEYNIDGREPAVDNIIYRDFKYFKRQLDIDNASYQKVVESRRVAGAAGGKKRQANQANATFGKQNEQEQANQADNDNDNDNDLLLSPIPPSSAKPQKREKKQKEETTLEKAISHYKTETEEARQAGAAADFENFRKLGLEICGLAPTDDCPNGMVKTIMRLPEQLTFKQYTKLVKKMGGHATLREILVAMHNKYTQYLTKSTSINLIAQDWYQNKMSGKGSGGAKPEATVAKKTTYGPQGE